jgi:hypothetical protein
MVRLSEIEANRQDRQNRRRAQRAQQTENFFKSLHMLQANTFLRESDSSSPFEDYSIYMYRQNAPLFNDRVKEMEKKLKYPVSERVVVSLFCDNYTHLLGRFDVCVAILTIRCDSFSFSVEAIPSSSMSVGFFTRLSRFVN